MAPYTECHKNGAGLNVEKRESKKEIRGEHSMRRKDIKGFTLAELLIVVAIIGVLVAISIPIFSKQLEKSRDATSVANLRSAYAEAMTAYLTNDVAKSHWTSDSVHHVWINYKNGEINAIDVIVNIKSKKQNDWSGLGKNLPSPLNTIKDNKANPGSNVIKISS